MKNLQKFSNDISIICRRNPNLMVKQMTEIYKMHSHSFMIAGLNVIQIIQVVALLLEGARMYAFGYGFLELNVNGDIEVFRRRVILLT